MDSEGVPVGGIAGLICPEHGEGDRGGGVTVFSREEPEEGGRMGYWEAMSQLATSQRARCHAHNLRVSL